MFIHDCIKIQYSTMGYLPGYPYYLISDAEMFDAFMREDGFFNDWYPCPCSGDCPCESVCPGYAEREEYPDDPSKWKTPLLQEAYNTLRQYISDTIDSYQANEIASIPDWIYSYMIGSCITYQSDELDLYYLNDLLGADTAKGAPEFTTSSALACLAVSSAWLNKQPTKLNRRPPTMFGEPHVIKSLRLDQANILLG